MQEDAVLSEVRLALQDGGAIPSERELARQIKVNRHQIRRALGILREANEIEPAGARLAAVRASPLDIVRIQRAAIAAEGDGRNAPVPPKRLLERNLQHRAIAEAIAARDADAAERAMRVHLANVQRLVLSRISPDIAAA